MSSNISKLPPPFPNAAQALNRVASDAQLRARVDQASESAPIRAESAKSVLESPVLVKINDNQAAGSETQGSNGKVDIKV
jgi:hypothetical protein